MLTGWYPHPPIPPGMLRVNSLLSGSSELGSGLSMSGFKNLKLKIFQTGKLVELAELVDIVRAFAHLDSRLAEREK